MKAQGRRERAARRALGVRSKALHGIERYTDSIGKAYTRCQRVGSDAAQALGEAMLALDRAHLRLRTEIAGIRAAPAQDGAL